MKSVIAVSALVALVAAQNNTAPYGNAPGLKSCKDKHQLCTDSDGANCDAADESCKAACKDTFDSCSGAADANHASCVAAYSNCLGALPAFVSGGGQGGADTTSTTVVTQVVQSYTTYCPGATSIVNNGQTYVATGPTVITVTNCPCTVTSTLVGGQTPAPAANPPAAAPSSGFASGSCNGSGCPSGSKNGTTSVPVVPYKGAAASTDAHMLAAGLSAAAALAGVLAFAL